MIIDSPEEKRVFVVIYEKYRYLMMKVAHDVLKDNFLAEDAVHEAFIKIAHNMQNIHDVESVETKRYLIIVAKNAAIDIYRSRKKMKEKMFIEVEREMARYDIIAGKIADDATNATLTAYLAGAFGTAGDKEADDFCIRQLLPNKLKDQYCFKTEAAIKCLKFVKGRNRELSPHS